MKKIYSRKAEATDLAEGFHQEESGLAGGSGICLPSLLQLHYFFSRVIFLVDWQVEIMWSK